MHKVWGPIYPHAMTEGESCRDIQRVTSSAAMIFSFPDMEIADGTLRYPKGCEVSSQGFRVLGCYRGLWEFCWGMRGFKEGYRGSTTFCEPMRGDLCFSSEAPSLSLD